MEPAKTADPGEALMKANWAKANIFPLWENPAAHQAARGPEKPYCWKWSDISAFAEQALAVMPMIPRKGPNLESAPTRQVRSDAHDAVCFLKMLVQRGQRHGFAKASLETIESLGDSIDERIEFLCEAARQNPDAAPVIEAQAKAAAELCDELYDDGRGPGFVRKVISALRASA